jgi:hypothetical protein
MSSALCTASACFTIAVLPTRFGIEAQRLLRARYPTGPSLAACGGGAGGNLGSTPIDTLQPSCVLAQLESV